jgi:hypothetical protein
LSRVHRKSLFKVAEFNLGLFDYRLISAEPADPTAAPLIRATNAGRLPWNFVIARRTVMGSLMK